jgi:cytochrome c
MIHPVPVEAFRGKMRPAPRGTIAQGETPYPYENSPVGADRAAREHTNPLPPTAENLKRGQEVYEANCLMCHGSGGQGDGQLIPRFPNPPSFTASNMKNMTEGHIYHVITYGLGDMASHAWQVDPMDRWKVSQYIKKLQAAQAASEVKK